MDDRVEGKPCSQCGDIVTLMEIFCYRRNKNKEPMETKLNCRCMHMGDFMCNCGNPCSPMF